MTSPPPTSPSSPLCGSGNSFTDRICNIVAGCPITMNTLYSFYSNFLNYLSTNKNIVLGEIIKILAYHYAPTYIIALVILFGMWFSGSIGFGGFLILFVIITLVMAGTFVIAYFDYSRTVANLNSADTHQAIDNLLFAAYSQSDQYNKFKCFS